MKSFLNSLPFSFAKTVLQPEFVPLVLWEAGAMWMIHLLLGLGRMPHSLWSVLVTHNSASEAWGPMSIWILTAWLLLIPILR